MVGVFDKPLPLRLELIQEAHSPRPEPRRNGQAVDASPNDLLEQFLPQRSQRGQLRTLHRAQSSEQDLSYRQKGIELEGLGWLDVDDSFCFKALLG
jgi:hypothetical protein